MCALCKITHYPSGAAAIIYCLRSVRGILKCILALKCRLLSEPSNVIEGKFVAIFCCYGYLRYNAGQRFRVGIHICMNLVRYNKFLDSDKDYFDIRQYLANNINKSPSLHKKGK